MSDRFQSLLVNVRAWFDRAAADGWLAPDARPRLDAVEAATPADLFAERDGRPLVVAFFGGTGVGKSSLLNRLAGQPLARVAAERPTSRQVTLYVHDSVKLGEFAPDAPLGEVRIERHSHVERRNVAWIDMPDIDSTEPHNRQLALAWLPHVDLLVYVVSPERYRDDAGWRVLRERGARHAWIFVMNHWDEGVPGQSEDFTRLLRNAGFENPVLLHTSCGLVRAGESCTLPSPDEFPQLEQEIAALLANHGIDELVRLGRRARLNDVRAALLAALLPLGDDERWARLRESVRTQWRQTRDAICAAADWPIAVAAGRLAVREGGFLRQIRGGVAWLRGGGAADVAAAALTPDGRPVGVPGADESAGALLRPGAASDLAFLSDALWDDWPQAKLESFLDVVELESRRAGLASGPPRRAVGECVIAARDDIAREVQQTIRSTLANPGTAMQRLIRRGTGFLMVFLPCIALMWIAYKVVLGFHAGGTGGAEYLGTPFAINALLLLAVAWGVPFALDRALRPSLEHALRRALRESFGIAVDQLGNRMLECFGASAREAAAQREAAKALAAEIAAAARVGDAPQVGELARVVVQSSAVARQAVRSPD